MSRTYEAFIKVEIEVRDETTDLEIDAALDSIVDHSTARDAIEQGLFGWRPDSNEEARESADAEEILNIELVGFYLQPRHWPT